MRGVEMELELEGVGDEQREEEGEDFEEREEAIWMRELKIWRDIAIDMVAVVLVFCR